jgi:hypothetical protein
MGRGSCFLSDYHQKSFNNALAAKSKMSLSKISIEFDGFSDLTPNEKDPPKVRLRKAKAWLLENPGEKNATAARIFKVNGRTLSNSIKRETNPYYGGQNRILSPAQEHAMHTFIRDWLEHGQKPTRAILFGAICKLRHSRPPPSQNWFLKWWKKKGLHKVKTKPIAKVRVTAQDEKEVEEWWHLIHLYVTARMPLSHHMT